MIYLIISNFFLIILILACFLSRYMNSRYKLNVVDRFINHINLGYYKYREKDGVIIAVNEGFLKILDLAIKTDDVVGKSLSELIIYSEDEDYVRKKLTESKQLWNYEYSFKTINGKSKWALHNSYRSRDKYSGDVVIEVVLQDITEEKLAFEKMKKSEERYKKLFKNSGDIVCLCSIDGMIIQQINPVAEIVTGFDIEEIEGMTLESFLHPNYRKKLEELKQDLIFKGVSESEVVIVCKDGGYKEMLITASAVEMEDENIAILIIKDVSGLIRDREEQKKRNKEMEDFCNASVEREQRIRELTNKVESLKTEVSSLREKYEKQ